MEYTAKEHWDDVWTRKKSNEVSWYQEDPNTSLEMILSANPSKDVGIIDVGGGDSKLVDKLLELDFKNISVLDISEKESMEKFVSCSCRTLLMEDVPKALVVGRTKGLIKMVIHPQTQQILEVHILSDLAADIIHEATLAVKLKLTINDIIDTVHVFPTMSESIKLVATSFKKNVKELSCCVE